MPLLMKDDFLSCISSIMVVRSNMSNDRVGLLSQQARDCDQHRDQEDPSNIDPLSKQHKLRDWWRKTTTILMLAVRCILHILAELLPSFIANRWFPNLITSPLPSPRIHKTSWLDGLRGIASLSVVANHWSGLLFHQSSDIGYGHYGPLHPGSTSASFLQLPIVRLLYAGHASVALFFVISGYALSIRPISLMTQASEDGTEALRAMGSSVFRRFFRLYLPSWASTVVPLGITILGWYPPVLRPQINPFIGPGNPLQHKMLEGCQSLACERLLPSARSLPLQQQSDVVTNVSTELARWIASNLNATTIFGYLEPPIGINTDSFESPYNLPLWTIPVEYRASLLLFLVQIAVFQFKFSNRTFITLILILYSIYANRFEMILFLGGFLIAQLDPILTTMERKLKESHKTWRCYNAFVVLALFLGLFLASFPPADGLHTPGFAWLAQHTPRTLHSVPYFWMGNGALLIVFAIGRIEHATSFFTTPLIQYFGRLSFSIYLVHFLFVRTVAIIVFNAFLTKTGNKDWHDFRLVSVGFGLALACLYALASWAGDVWYRFVDLPSIKFAKWLEGKLVA